MKLNNEIIIKTNYNDENDTNHSQLICDSDSTIGEVLTSLELAKKALLSSIGNLSEKTKIKDTKQLLNLKFKEMLP